MEAEKVFFQSSSLINIPNNNLQTFDFRYYSYPLQLMVEWFLKPSFSSQTYALKKQLPGVFYRKSCS